MGVSNPRKKRTVLLPHLLKKRKGGGEKGGPPNYSEELKRKLKFIKGKKQPKKNRVYLCPAEQGKETPGSEQEQKSATRRAPSTNQSDQ